MFLFRNCFYLRLHSQRIKNCGWMTDHFPAHFTDKMQKIHILMQTLLSAAHQYTHISFWFTSLKKVLMMAALGVVYSTSDWWRCQYAWIGLPTAPRTNILANPMGKGWLMSLDKGVIRYPSPSKRLFVQNLITWTIL